MFFLYLLFVLKASFLNYSTWLFVSFSEITDVFCFLFFIFSLRVHFLCSRGIWGILFSFFLNVMNVKLVPDHMPPVSH